MRPITLGLRSSRAKRRSGSCAKGRVGASCLSASVDSRGSTGLAEHVLGTVIFRDELIEAIRAHEKRFHEDAFVFVLAALRYAQSKLPVPRHVDGRELAYAVRDLALEKFGLMARLVLEYWGVRSTADLGDIVFAMVDAGFLASQPSDSKLDFQGVYDFDEAFDTCYPWSAAHLVSESVRPV